MGPENSPPTYLCYINPETGEQHKLMGLVENISLTEVEGFEDMSVGFQCQHCEHADPKRTHDGKIRCKRWSRWVEPNGRNCEEYGFTLPLSFNSEQHTKAMEYFQRKQKG